MVIYFWPVCAWAIKYLVTCRRWVLISFFTAPTICAATCNSNVRTTLTMVLTSIDWCHKDWNNDLTVYCWHSSDIQVGPWAIGKNSKRRRRIIQVTEPYFNHGFTAKYHRVLLVRPRLRLSGKAFSWSSAISSVPQLMFEFKLSKIARIRWKGHLDIRTTSGRRDTTFQIEAKSVTCNKSRAVEGS